MRGNNGILVMCETYLTDRQLFINLKYIQYNLITGVIIYDFNFNIRKTPARYNFRQICNKIMEEARMEH